MKWLKKLSWKQQRAKGAPEGRSKPWHREVFDQSDSDPPVEVRIQSITHAFVVLTHAAISHSAVAAEKIADFNRACQPRVWNSLFKAKFLCFSLDAADGGLPDLLDVPPALRQAGVSDDSSILINNLTVSFDGGKTHSKIWAGFTFHERRPRLILPRSDGCVPR